MAKATKMTVTQRDYHGKRGKAMMAIESMDDKQLIAAVRKAMTDWDCGNDDDVMDLIVFDYNELLLEELGNRMGQ